MVVKCNKTKNNGKKTINNDAKLINNKNNISMPNEVMTNINKPKNVKYNNNVQPLGPDGKNRAEYRDVFLLI